MQRTIFMRQAAAFGVDTLEVIGQINRAVMQGNATNLHDAVLLRVKPGGLQIEHHPAGVGAGHSRRVVSSEPVEHRISG